MLVTSPKNYYPQSVLVKEGEKEARREGGTEEREGRGGGRKYTGSRRRRRREGKKGRLRHLPCR